MRQFGSSLFPPFLSASPSCRWLGLYRGVGVWEGRRRSCTLARASSALLSGVRGAKRDRERRLKASFIITCVGSVAKATLRLANATAWNTNEALGRAAGGAAQSATAHGGHCCHSAPGTLRAEISMVSPLSSLSLSTSNGAGDKLSCSMSFLFSLRYFIDSAGVVLFGGFSWAAKRQGGHKEGLDTPCLLILTESLISANWVGQFKQAQQSGVSHKRDMGANRQTAVALVLCEVGGYAAHRSGQRPYSLLPTLKCCSGSNPGSIS
ncbi:hypothetical protein QQF64_011632 [Cirrhinus molitorella]|uniref:Uncharacterized protein n=1 Tax=Cirrhinus molitorella TaxID=172907 RepID=A0ABR3LZW3_9TELE